MIFVYAAFERIDTGEKVVHVCATPECAWAQQAVALGKFNCLTGLQASLELTGVA